MSAPTLKITKTPAGGVERLAPPAGCTVSEPDAQLQLDRVRALAPHISELTRSRTQLTITFDPSADRAALAAFAQTERGCCRFFDEITDQSTAEGLVLHYASHDGSRAGELGEIAALFDRGGADVDTATIRRRNARGAAGLLAALGIACAACLIPGLAIGGAGIFAAGAIGADELLMGAAALALAGYGIYAITSKRRRQTIKATDAGCGC